MGLYSIYFRSDMSKIGRKIRAANAAQAKRIAAKRFGVSVKSVCAINIGEKRVGAGRFTRTSCSCLPASHPQLP